MGYWTEAIHKCATEQFKYVSLLPVQQLVVHNIMEAVYPQKIEKQNTVGSEDEVRDVYQNQLIILPTGTGKSACFQIPASLINGFTVIIYPLLSLINDQIRKLNDVGLESYRLVGGMNPQEIQAIKNALKNKTIKCVLTNPETLNNKSYINMLAIHKPSLLVVDEAHCISKWGNSFRKTYLSIGRQIELLETKTVVAFTGTASDTVIADIKQLLFLNKDMYLLRGHADRENITYSVLHCFDKYQTLRSLLAEDKNTLIEKGNIKNKINTHQKFGLTNSIFKTWSKLALAKKETPLALGMYPIHTNFGPVKRPALVFCSSRSDCSELSLMLRDTLKTDNIYFYHAGLSKSEKNKIEEWFLYSEDGILIATCAYGMGVDKSNIRTVIHYEPYRDIENFLQETGRAGRDKIESISIMLEPFSFNTIVEESKLTCRRNYFMKALSIECEGCSGCDICIHKTPIISWELDFILSILHFYNYCLNKNEFLARADTCLKKYFNYFDPVDLEESDSNINYPSIVGFANFKQSNYVELKLQIYKALDLLLKEKLLLEGKFLWKDRIYLNKKKYKILQEIRK